LSALEGFCGSVFDSAESFDPEFFSFMLTTEGLVAGCGSLVLKFEKAQRHQYSTFDVGRSMFNLFTVPAR
jgi:hypothetical protein